MIEIIVIVLCLVLNALLAAAELAFVYVRKSSLRKLAEEGNERAAKVLKKRENPERTLSVLQLGITFIGVVAAAVGGAGSVDWLKPILQSKLGLSESMSGPVAILLFVIPYTFLSIVISELIPKSLALRNPKWVIFRVDRWLTFFGKLFAPVVFLLEKATKFGVECCFSWVRAEEPELEVGKLLRPYMVNLARFEKKRLLDVMVPWEETVKITKSLSMDKVKRVVHETRHTRLPVLEGPVPVGILHAKEFLSLCDRGETSWEGSVMELICVQEHESLIEVLRKMQGRRSHMSVVFSGQRPVGMVTIEDILEEVVGEIYDEDERG